MTREAGMKVWSTPVDERPAVGLPDSGVHIWVEGRLLDNPMWLRVGGRVQPRVATLTVDLVMLALGHQGAIYLLVAVTDEIPISDEIRGLGPPAAILHDEVERLLFVLSEGPGAIRDALDGVFGLGEEWRLFKTEGRCMSPMEIVAPRNVSVAVTDIDGEVLDVQLRDIEQAPGLCDAIASAAAGAGLSVCEGP